MADSPGIGRRHALALIGGAAASAPIPAFGGPAEAVSCRGFDPMRDPLTTYILTPGALDDRLVIGCVQGQYFGVVDGLLTPLFGLAAATFARYRMRPGGGYDVANG